MMFTDKVAIVTGGGAGIGAAAAQRLAQEGAAVVVADIVEDRAERIATRIVAAGGAARAIAADVSSEEDNERIFALAVDAFGGVDAAFLNAGLAQRHCPLDEVTPDMFDQMIAVNLRGAFLGVKCALRTLRPNGACLVNSSASGLIGFSEGAAYTAAKHGVVGLVRASAIAFSAHQLRINAICPGGTLTAMLNAEQDDSILAADALDAVPYARRMSPQVVAEMAVFLLSPRAAAMTGQATLIDAGRLATYPPIA